MNLEQQLVQLVKNATKVVAADIQLTDSLILITANGAIMRLPMRQLANWVAAQQTPPPPTPNDDGTPLPPGTHVYA